MKQQASIRYQLWIHRASVSLFYLIVAAICLVLLAVKAAYGSDAPVNFNGLELLLMIFLFISGCESFGESFAYLLQNGVSRKTFLAGQLAVGLALSLGTAVVNEALMSLSHLLGSGDFLLTHLVAYFYFIPGPEATPWWQVTGASLLFTIGAGFGAFFAGFLLASAHYRMPRQLKWLIPAGVPLGIFVVLPLTDTLLTGGRGIELFAHLIDLFTGFSAGSPLTGMVSFLCAGLAAAALSWLVIRRAPL